ncbi:DUF2147 domain-containing protein [Sphingomonas sp.]|jgi:uncharacterized protein (DUF2147 family)|uniref:DUF2147 domain-containing protein n=1 Tax=Sphingomonas sp. TaxID=28214 RepID=UPI002E326E2D|nr:DUF2147 domain-containing protein [Sphingomonas sp.]HEX4694384.1 DUF2147 domain-containing protein [Sphingomonas sp.]
MKRTVSRLLTCAALMLAPIMLPAAAAAGPEPVGHGTQSWAGVWRNTNNTVHIKASPCGDGMCATVIWANDKTKADVAAKGHNIIGMQLLRNFHQSGPAEWRGTVYVPDLDTTISGKITMTDRNTLAAVGCGFLGLVCQTRHWSRIS